MRASLQRQLTLSHLLVTVISVALLALLLLTGYAVYLQTPLPARWAGDEAAWLAEEAAYSAADMPLDEAFARDFLEDMVDPAEWPAGALPYEDPADPADPTDPTDAAPYGSDADFADWLLLLSPEGRILASNFPRLYPVGARIEDVPPPALDLAWLASAEGRGDLLDAVFYARQGSHQVGFAAIVADPNELLGWIYFRASDRTSGLILGQAALALGLGLLVAAAIALLVSGYVGRLLARSFGQRLRALSKASAAFAAGDLEGRATVPGKDEIAQLGRQFNAMADRLSGQLRDLRQLAERNAALAAEAEGLAKLEERNRLARDLHDAVKQQLFALNLTIGAIRPLVRTRPELAEARLTELTHLTRDVLQELDHIIRQLRPASLADRGLAPALTELAGQWSEQSGVPVAVAVQQARELPVAVEQALYRIAQESLANVLRHARAGRVELSLDYDLEGVTLKIRDDGRGFDPEAPHAEHSFGLAGMRERAAELGGSFELGSSPGQGTIVTVKVPAAALEADRA